MEQRTYIQETDEALAALSLEYAAAYNVLVERHREALVRFVFKRFTQERFAAEDVAQEAFMRAYVSLRTFDPSKKFKTWLYAIAVNAARSATRPGMPEDIEAYSNVLCSTGISPESHLQASFECTQLSTALSCLERHYRVVLDMHYRQELTYVEIGSALGLRLSTVKTRIFRAKQQLRVHFKAYGYYGASL